MVPLPKVVDRETLDMSLMINTAAVASQVQDILTHLPRLMGWSLGVTEEEPGGVRAEVRMVQYDVRNCRVHMELVPKVFLYNMSIWAYDSRKASRVPGRPAEGKGLNCPPSSGVVAKPDAVAVGNINGLVEEIWVDVLWRGAEDVKIMYVSRERDAWRVPEAANEGTGFCMFSRAS